jgi:hypothetical protein
MQLAVDVPGVSKLSEREFIERWSAEQFPTANASAIADVMRRYYQLNFLRKPEFMGFNGYNDDIHRTGFNPNAWGDQNATRLAEWSHLRDDEQAIAKRLPPQYASAFFELVGYPVEAAAAQNEKFLYTDRSFLYATLDEPAAMKTAAIQTAAERAQTAFDTIQSLTARYNSLDDGKWAGMMSSAPRERHVFEMPRTATLADAATPLPAAWFGGTPPPFNLQQNGERPMSPAGFREQFDTVSINAADFARSSESTPDHWRVLSELGISGRSVEYAYPGLLANEPAETPAAPPSLDYDFTTTTAGPATLAIYLLPTFPLDANHRLRFAASLDGHTPIPLDAGATGEWHEDTAPVWAANVLRNAAIVTLPLGDLTMGKHTLRLLYVDPGVVFEHIVITFPGAPPAYPVPPETNVHP